MAENSGSRNPGGDNSTSNENIENAAPENTPQRPATQRTGRTAPWQGTEPEKSRFRQYAGQAYSGTKKGGNWAWNFLRQAWAPTGLEDLEKHQRLVKEFSKLIWLSILTTIVFLIMKVFPTVDFINTLMFIAGLFYVVEIFKILGVAIPNLQKIVNFILLIVLIPLFMRYFAWGVTTISKTLPFIPVIVIAIGLLGIGLSFCMYVLEMFNWAKIMIAIYYLIWIYILFFYTGVIISEGEDYNLIQQQTEIFTAWFESIKGTFDFIGEGIERQIAIASGDYFTGQVDQYSKQKLGVFLEDIGTLGSYYTTNEKVDVYATLKAETIGKKDELSIEVSCESDKIKGQILPQQYRKISVSKFEQTEIDCMLPAGSLDPGLHTVTFKVDFEFDTSAYNRMYFMPREFVRSQRSQEKDPLDFFKIEDKNPTTIYTQGPIGIGMGTRTGQPITVDEKGAGPTISITLENKWEGKIKEINKMEITLPKGLTIETINGETKFKKTATDAENTYEINQTTLNKIIEGSDDIKMLRVHTQVDPEEILKTAGEKSNIAIKNIKVNVDYKYEIKKDIDVNIRYSGK